MNETYKTSSKLVFNSLRRPSFASDSHTRNKATVLLNIGSGTPNRISAPPYYSPSSQFQNEIGIILYLTCLDLG